MPSWENIAKLGALTLIGIFIVGMAMAVYTGH
jgi:hypothetical protein